MSKTIFCIYLQREAEALDYQPWPGELGEEIQKNISKEAWQQWQQHQVLLINEYQLNSSEPRSIEFLEKSLKSYLFHQGEQIMPEGFNPAS